MEIYLTNHEEHTLIRRFDPTGEGLISLEDFYNSLSA
jgi:hypothetical protein